MHSIIVVHWTAHGRQALASLHTHIRSSWCIGGNPALSCGLASSLRVSGSCARAYVLWMEGISWGGRSGEYSPSLPPQVPSIHRTYARAARKPRTWHEWFPMRLLRGVAEPELVAGSLCLPPSPALPQLGETPPVLFVLYACRNGSPSYIKQLFEASRGARPAVSSFNHRRRYHPKQSKPIHNPRV